MITEKMIIQLNNETGNSCLLTRPVNLLSQFSKAIFRHDLPRICGELGPDFLHSLAFTHEHRVGRYLYSFLYLFVWLKKNIIIVEKL